MKIELTKEEQHVLDRLPKEPAFAWHLWHQIGARVGVDFSDPQICLGKISRGKYEIRKTGKKCLKPPVDYGW